MGYFPNRSNSTVAFYFMQGSRVRHIANAQSHFRAIFVADGVVQSLQDD